MPELNEELSRNLIQRVNVGDSLTRTAWRYPSKEAIVDGDRRFTYRAFNDRVNRTANALTSLGFAKGDALLLMSGNSAEFLFTYFACAKLGLICVPINLGWKMQEIAYVLEHSAARGAVVESQLVGAFVAAAEGCPSLVEVIVCEGLGARYVGSLPQCRWSIFDEVGDRASADEPEVLIEDRDPISYLYTSGTTSAPKGVVSSHLAVYIETLGVAAENGVSSSDRIGAMMPLFHTAQLNGQCTAAVAVGAAIVLLRGFEASTLLRSIEEERLTFIFALPFMFREMVDHPDVTKRDYSSLRLAVYAMAPMPDALLRRCIEIFDCGFTLGFGQTEMNPVTTVFRPSDQLSHSGSVGTPQINVQIGIMDSVGTLLPWGEVGEIVYRSPQAMTGYLHNPGATDDAFRFGWFHSGDVGSFDDDGILWFADRFKDVIKSGGENVASIEVEKALYAAEPNIAEVAVVGLPHDRWGEAITAFVVAKPGSTLTSEGVLSAVRSRLDGFKCPKSVVVVDELPRTSTGKVQKNVVRQDHATLYVQ